MQRTLAVRGVTGGLATVEPSAGNTLVAYAAKAGSVSYDGAGPNSPFTTALIKNLFEPGLDIRIALGRVRDEVMKMTANRQEPFVYGSLGGSTIALVKAAEPPAIASGRTGSSASRYDIQRDYEFAERIGTQRAWESFLKVHNTGYYAGLARAQLAKLNETAEKALPPVIASRDPQDRDDSGSTPRAPPPKDQQAKLEPKPSEDFHESSPGPAAPVIAVDSCKQEQEKLTRLRAKPVRDKIIHLERELTCERLRLQVVRLRESVVGDLPAAPGAAAVAPAVPIDGDDGDRTPQSNAIESTPQPKQDSKKAASSRSSDSCQRDQETLVRLRASPVRKDVLRFERDLACERLRPQVLRLRESLGIVD
jgi:hypothetical protein